MGKQKQETEARDVSAVNALVMPRIEITFMVYDGEPTKYSEEIMVTGIYGYGENRLNELKECAIEAAKEEAYKCDIPSDAFSATFRCYEFTEDSCDNGISEYSYWMCEGVDLISYLTQKGQEEPQEVCVV